MKMDINEFKECFEKVRNNVDKFIKEVELNDEVIRSYIQISEQVTNELERQEKEMLKYEDSVKFWRFHLEENRKYGFKELAIEIEKKLNEYDEKLREFLTKKEEAREKILEANKRK
jgi:hypothetical protein